jgi:ribonuclease P protein component
MLPFKNRLVKRKDFEKIYKHGNFFYFGAIGIKALKNDLNDTRIGISIGLKYSKKAVERNKIKRQIREIAKKNLTKIKSGFDVVITIKKEEKKNINFKELELMYEKALDKAGLIR